MGSNDSWWKRSGSTANTIFSAGILRRLRLFPLCSLLRVLSFGSCSGEGAGPLPYLRKRHRSEKALIHRLAIKPSPRRSFFRGDPSSRSVFLLEQPLFGTVLSSGISIF